MNSKIEKNAPAHGKSAVGGMPESIKSFITETMKAMSRGSRFTVFLCGPYIDFSKQEESDLGVILRRKIKDRLEEGDFEVVLGENNGLEKLRSMCRGNAQDNELDFISKYCNAIVIVASSVGSFCELGLFSWHFVHGSDRGIINRVILPSFIVLAEEKYKPKKQGTSSYFHEGPIRALQGNGGYTFYVDFNEFDIDTIVEHLDSARAVQLSKKRGPWAGGRR